MKGKWLLVVIFALFGWYLVGNNFSAKLGMIDDHEIAMFLGPDGRVTLGEFPRLLMSTEVGKYGEYLRFRPAYYTLRILETMLWGDNAMLWYLARYVIVVVLMLYLYQILARYFPKLVSLLTVFYLFTLPFWADLLTRLGPSEVYAMLGLPMFVWGGIKVLGKKPIKQDWAQLVLGYLLCVGSKENFLVLWPILVGLAGVRLYQRRVSKWEGILYLALTAFTGWIGAAVYLATSRSGVDIYATSISYPARVKWFFIGMPEMLKERKIWFSTIVGALFAFLEIRAFFTKGIKTQLKNPVLWQWVVLVVLAGVVMSQYVLYNNELPTNTRYDFPALLLFPIMNLISLKLLLSGVKKKLPSLYKPTRLFSYMIVTITLVVLIVSNGYSRVRAQATKNVLTTQSFAATLELVEEKLEQDQQVPLVMVAERYIQFEPISSVSRHLSARGVQNPIILKYKPQQVGADDKLGQNLNERLEEVREVGSESEELFARFSPYSEDLAECYSVSFGSELASECELLAIF